MLIAVTQCFKAPLPAVYAWCTDFQDSDPQVSRVRLRTRRVLRREALAVEMNETGVMGFPFRAHFAVSLEPPAGWKAEASSNMGSTRNTYLLAEAGGETSLSMTFDIRLKGPYKLMAPFATGFVRRRIEREWSEFAAAMEKSAAQTGNAGA